VHLRQPVVQLGLPLLETRLAFARRPGLSEDFGPPLGPGGSGNEIRRGIGIAAAVRHPDIARTEGTTQVPEGAQFVVAAAQRSPGLPDVGAPGVRDDS
jgi:hypothetical protein